MSNQNTETQVPNWIGELGDDISRFAQKMSEGYPKIGLVLLDELGDRDYIADIVEEEGVAWLGTAESEEEFRDALETARGE